MALDVHAKKKMVSRRYHLNVLDSYLIHRYKSLNTGLARLKIKSTGFYQSYGT